jgi:transcriptional regulator with XRE-family HTH domain
LPVSGRPELRPDRAERVREALRGLLRDRFDENVTALAKALRRSQSGVSQILAGKNDPSFETAERVARLLGVTVQELLEEGTGVGARSALLSSRPNLREALDWVTSRGKATEEAVQAVLAAAGHLPDLEASTWITMLTDAERKFRERTDPPPEA